MKDVRIFYKKKLNDLKKMDLLRSLKKTDFRQGKTIRYNDKICLNLSSNDYLGIATDEKLCSEFYSEMNEENMINSYGLSSSSSRLLTGNSGLYEELENRLCRFYNRDAALIFNSGYHANTGLIPALTEKNDLILSDSLNHASVVDGIRLSKAECIIFRHIDMAHLESILEEKRDKYENVLIITEAVFSMDGDCADVKTLVELKEKFNAMLYVDEAHSVGVYGKNGQGLCCELKIHDRVDIILGTMGKALASHGAFAITDTFLKEFLINKTRSLLYTTALPPVAVNWNLFVINHMELFSEQRKKLCRVSQMFRNALKKQGISFTGETHIIPVITRSNKKAIKLAHALVDHGFLVFPIRPPTVAENNSRVRFSLTSDIEYKEIEMIPEIISTCFDG